MGRIRTGGNHRTLEDQHTAFLTDYFDENAAAALWQARDSLLLSFPGLSITLSAIHKHLVINCSLTLKRLYKIPEARNSERTINLRIERVSERIKDTNIDFRSNCVFIDEAGFNMHLR
jgi:hypothetical protein